MASKYIYKYKKMNVITMKCTPNHRIYIKNNGWTKSIEILENDKVL